ncbi:hypothetical protein [Acidimangrovimonas pyrenivorans]|uniref:Uncharacterized protein n=1 Tax=Acidimangrovimonas pyrenivorans TaxID=2030798 RepID=A0ABV7ABI8_9RHOB
MTRRALRTLLPLALSLVLAATGLTMAVARGQARVAGKIVVCSGYGLTTIYVDENGKEVPKVHICPDCVLALMAALAVEAPQLVRPETRMARLTAPERRLAASRPGCPHCARDPPLSA